MSSRELVELTLAHIDVLDSDLNAFGAVYADRAWEHADRADRRRAAVDDAPLLGVPLAHVRGGHRDTLMGVFGGDEVVSRGCLRRPYPLVGLVRRRGGIVGGWRRC